MAKLLPTSDYKVGVPQGSMLGPLVVCLNFINSPAKCVEIVQSSMQMQMLNNKHSPERNKSTEAKTLLYFWFCFVNQI